MNDPVLATKSGVTYDRTALLQCLERKLECPMTRTPMTRDDMTSNRALKNMIEAWQTEQLSQAAAVEAQETAAAVQAAQRLTINTKPDTISPVLASQLSFEEQTLGDIKIDLVYDSVSHKTLLQVTPPAKSDHHSGRKPMKIAICIDVSGSMDMEAPIKNLDGTKESTGMNVLDIVRACGVAIVESLSEHDRVSIIKYTEWFREKATKMARQT